MEFHPLRPGLQWSVVAEGVPEPALLAQDPLEYTPQPFAVPLEAYPIIEALATAHSWDSLWQRLQKAGFPRSAANQEALQGFVQQLDEFYALLSPRFDQRRREWEATYRSQPLRTAALAGICYPEDPGQLRQFLGESLDSAPAIDLPSATPIAAVIPHIDLRIGISSYAATYQVLHEVRPELVVVLGTSHYGWHAPYIVTEKDFQTPLGTLPTARDLVRQLCHSCPDVVTDVDIAHKPEHSLEFQLLFLQHLFGNDIQVLPILVTSFGEFVLQQRSPGSDARMARFFQTLRELVRGSGRRTLWIASADMSHIGQKFGDSADARRILPAAEAHDRSLLEAMRHADAETYFRLISAVGDRFRICGLPPVYTLLATLQPRYGVLTDYQQWYEAETRSAVTFAGMLYYA